MRTLLPLSLMHRIICNLAFSFIVRLMLSHCLHNRYLSNRAACYLKLDKPSDAMADCTKALELLTKEEELLMNELVSESASEKAARLKSRIKLLVRKGAAALAMGDLKSGLKEYKTALTLDPRNEELVENVENLEKQMPIKV